MDDPTPLPSIETSLSPNKTEEMVASFLHLWPLIVVALAYALHYWPIALLGPAGAACAAVIRPLGSKFITLHAKEAAQFHAGACLGGFAGLHLMIFLLSGVPLLAMLLVLGLFTWAGAWLICSTKAAMLALNGYSYRYPFTLRPWA